MLIQRYDCPKCKTIYEFELELFDIEEKDLVCSSEDCSGKNTKIEFVKEYND